MNPFPVNSNVFFALQVGNKFRSRLGTMESMTCESVPENSFRSRKWPFPGTGRERFPLGNNRINDLRFRSHGNVPDFPQAKILKIKRYRVPEFYPPTGGGGGRKRRTPPVERREEKAITKRNIKMIDALLTKKHPAFGGCRCVLCLETWANQPHAWQVDAETVGPFTIGEIEACEMVYRPRTEAHGGQTMTWIIKPAHFSAIEQSIKVGQAPWLALTTQSVAGKPALVMSGSVPGAWTIGPPQPLQCEGSIQASTGPFHRHGIARGMVKPVTPPTTSGAWLLAYINFAEPGGKCMELHLIWNYIRPMNRHTLILSHSYGGANNSAELGVVSPDSWSGFELQVYRDGCKCSVNQGPPVKMAVNLPGIASLYPWQWCLFFGQPGVMDPAWAEIEMGTSE